MALYRAGIFRRWANGEGPSDRDGPFRIISLPHQNERTMTKEQLQQLAELEDKVHELRGYL